MFEYNLWEGQVVLYDILVHTPLREEWRWSSPVIGRIGKLYVEWNWTSWLLHVWTLRSLERAPLDVMTVEVVDVQIFVERREQVFNFYLLDDTILLPDPITSSQQQQQEQQQQQQQGDDHDDENVQRSSDDDGDDDNDHVDNKDSVVRPKTKTQRQDDGTIASTLTTMTTTNPTSTEKQQLRHLNNNDKAVDNVNNDNITDEEEAAQQLVDEMLSTVQQAVSSAASQRGGGWKGALDQQRQSLTRRLKELQSQPNKVSAVTQGVRVIRQVGHAVAKNMTQDATTVTGGGSGQASSRRRLPVRKSPDSLPPPPNVRVGRVVIRRMHIFTQDTSPFTSTTTTTTTTKESNKNNTTDATNMDSTSNVLLFQEWNKPIRIEMVVVRASELCPPMSSMVNVSHCTTEAAAAAAAAATTSSATTVLYDTNDNDKTSIAPMAAVLLLPAIYQPLDKVLDVVWKRILAESAKSQGGRLLNAAIGQVLGFIKG